MISFDCHRALSHLCPCRLFMAQLETFRNSVSSLRSAFSKCNHALLHNTLEQLITSLTNYTSLSTFDFSRYQFEIQLLHNFAKDVDHYFSSGYEPSIAMTTKHLNRALKLRDILYVTGFFYTIHPSLLASAATSALKICNSLGATTSLIDGTATSSPSESRPSLHEMTTVLRSVNCMYGTLELLVTSPINFAFPFSSIKKTLSLHNPSRCISPSSAVTAAPCDVPRFATVFKLIRPFLNSLSHSPVPLSRKVMLSTFISVFLDSPFIPDLQLPKTLSPFLERRSLASEGISGVISSDHKYGNTPSATPVTVKSYRLRVWDDNLYLRFCVAAYRLRAIQHPSIVALHGVFCPCSKPEQPSAKSVSTRFAHVITERMWTSLLIAYSLPALASHGIRTRILSDVLSALIVLHEAGVCHGAVNARTVLLRANTNFVHGGAKLDLPPLIENAIMHSKLTSSSLDILFFQPPEMLHRAGAEYLTADIWSFGVLACLLLTKSPPETLISEYDTSLFLSNGPFRTVERLLKNIGDDGLRSVLGRCFHQDPVDRITAFELKRLLEGYLNFPDEPRATDFYLNPESSFLDGDIAYKYFPLDKLILDHNEEASVDGANQPNANHLSEVTSCSPLGSHVTGRFQSVMYSDGGSFKQMKPPSMIALRRDSSHPFSMHPSTDGHGNDKPMFVDGNHSSVLANGLSHEASESFLENQMKSVAYCGVKRTANEVLEAEWRKRAAPERDYLNFCDKATVNGGEVVHPVSRNPTSFSAGGDGTLHTERRNDNVKSIIPGNAPDCIHQGRALDCKLPSDCRRFETESKAHVPTADVKESLEPEGRVKPRSRRGRRVVYAEASSEDDSDFICENSSVDTQANRAATGGETKNHFFSGVKDEDVLIIPRHFSQRHDSLDQKGSHGHNSFPTAYGIQCPVESDCLLPPKVVKKRGRSEPLSPEIANPFAANGSQSFTGPYLNDGRASDSALHRSTELSDGNIPSPGWNDLQMGTMFELGTGVDQSFEQAVLHYTNAMEYGCQAAKVRLARCMELGLGVPKDLRKAASHYLSAASLNDRDGLFHAGRCFEDGIGFDANQGQALEYYNRAARLGDVAAMMRVAKICESTSTMASLSRSFHMYSSAAERGHLEAKVKLASCYAKGTGTKRCLQRAVELYREASNAGDPSAMLALGLLYEDGRGVKKNCDLALRFYRKSAAMGHGPGITALGQCYVWAYGVEQNYAEAIKLFAKAGALGHGLAYHEMGMLYKHGSGVDQNYTKAVEYFRKAVALNCEVAMVQLGECLYNGHGAIQNFKEAFELFRKGADLGAQEAFRWLGDCFADGSGTEKDEKKALENYRKAADLGSAAALTSLASCYENGFGVNANMSRAVSTYRKAADGGDPTAHNNLGILHEKGKHVKKDFVKAVHHYKLAIEYGSIEAMCNLADCYATGSGVSLNMTTAIKWYKEGANQGHAGALCELGICYMKGKGVAQDTAQAIGLFHLAADREGEAARQLGRAYMEGDGVTLDAQKGFTFFRSAAEMGNIDAYFDLGNCFRLGRGVKIDEDQAMEHYQKASEAGNSCSKAALGNMFYNKGRYDEAFQLLSSTVTDQGTALECLSKDK